MRTATFESTVDILVKAYLNGTLFHGRCIACAVGNIVAHSLNFKVTFNDWTTPTGDRRFPKEVICITSCDWRGTSTRKKFAGPKKDEIVTVVDEATDNRNRLTYILAEYPQTNANGSAIGYVAENFADIGSISELQSILETQPQEV